MGKNINKKLETAFNEFIEAIGLGHVPKDSMEMVERRRAFYGGASIMYDEFTQVMPLIEDEEVCMQFIEDLGTEIDNFVAGVEIGER